MSLRFKAIKAQCVFVDLDYTLINVNTTFDFLSTFYYRRYFVLSRLLYPLVFLNKIVDSDVYKQALLMLCVGKETKAKLDEYSRTYTNFLLRHKNLYFNIQLLEYLDSINQKKILLTSSIDMVAAHLGQLGFDKVISSEMCFRNNRLLCLHDLYHRKHKVIRKFSDCFAEMLIIEDTPEPQYFEIKGLSVLRVFFK
jgi:hypothetical protein